MDAQLLTDLAQSLAMGMLVGGLLILPVAAVFSSLMPHRSHGVAQSLNHRRRFVSARPMPQNKSIDLEVGNKELEGLEEEAEA